MNLIRQQIAYGQSIRPQGVVAPVWHSLVQDWVNRESFQEWANNSNSGYTLPVEEKSVRSVSLRKIIHGILP